MLADVWAYPVAAAAVLLVIVAALIWRSRHPIRLDVTIRRTDDTQGISSRRKSDELVEPTSSEPVRGSDSPDSG